MKIKDEINRLKNLSESFVAVSRKEFGKQCKEYCYLYRHVYNSLKNPNMNITVDYGTTHVYVEKEGYVEMLKDFALLRYKFSRKKFKGYVR